MFIAPSSRLNLRLPAVAGVKWMLCLTAVLAHFVLSSHHAEHAAESGHDHDHKICDLCQMAMDSPLKNERLNHGVVNSPYRQAYFAPLASQQPEEAATGAFNARAPPAPKFS